MSLDRAKLRYVLSVLWLFDAALQFQPFMFSHGFAADVLRPAGDGQPVVVAGPVHAMATLVAGSPALFNGLFAISQLLLAIGLAFRRTAKLALAASIGWSLAVWWLGEGLGGLLSAHAMLLTGAPGAVVLYAVLAVAAWPRRGLEPERRQITPSLLIGAWSLLWLLGALLQVLPGQNQGSDISAALQDAAGGAPGWLAHFDSSLAAGLPRGAAIALALALVQAMIGVAALVPGFTRTAALTAGIMLTAGFWVIGQSFGQIATGHATDPNTGPLIFLLAIAVIGSLHRGRPRPAAGHPGESARRLGTSAQAPTVNLSTGPLLGV